VAQVSKRAKSIDQTNEIKLGGAPGGEVLPPVLPVVLSAVAHARFEALPRPSLTFPAFLGWKIAAALACIPELLAASTRAGIVPVGYLRLSRSEYADADCEQQN
jgi:hypothetical protein